MKTYALQKIYRGIQIEWIVCCNTNKEAALAFDCSLYMIKNWAFCLSKEDPIASLQPSVIFARFFKSGEIPYFVPKEKIGVTIPLDEAKSMIDKHREKFKTHKDASLYYDKEG
jgi:hypothetical protein